MKEKIKINLEIPTTFETGVRQCSTCLDKKIGQELSGSLGRVSLANTVANVECACGLNYPVSYSVYYDPSGERTRIELLPLDDEVNVTFDEYFLSRELTNWNG
jgi:hypothetical protein